MPATSASRVSRWAQPFRAAVWISVLALLLMGLVWLAAQAASGMRETRAAAERDVARAEAALRDVPLLQPGEIARLRRSRNARHGALAESLGVEPPDRLSDLPAGLVRVDTLASVVVQDGAHSDPLLTPDGAHALRLVARRFRERLGEAGIPVFRPVATSLLRSAESQAALRGVNANAAAGRSSHEYGTTFDLSYRRFQPDVPDIRVAARVPAPFRSAVRRAIGADVADARARLAAEYPSRLDALLGRALAQLEDEGAVAVVRERNQTVYHVTAARRFHSD